MKRNILIAVAFMATMTLAAQNIAVVSPSNATKTYMTLDTAIKGTEDGSIIYLPGGGWVINDTTKIDKRLTIMGVSHRGDTDNTDGATIIGGNLNFVANSSGSAVMGCYISGDVNIGTANDAVNNILIRYCNLNRVSVKNSGCQGITVNQNYIRKLSQFGNSNPTISNNIIHSLGDVNGGIINHNIIKDAGYIGIGSRIHPLGHVYYSSIMNNFFLNWRDGHLGNNCQILNNCIGSGSWGDNPVILDEGITWDDVFFADKGVNINSDYRLKGKWGKNASTDGSDIGIFGGSNFSLNALAPIPRIVSKTVDEQTDGSGRLLINITVKAQ